MKTNFLQLVFLISSTLIIYSSCRKEYLEPIPCFETDVLPIFQSHCANSGCHNSIDKEEGYDLTNYEGILEGIRKGKPHFSEIYEVITEKGEDRMPPVPYEPLNADDIETIRHWISLGAVNQTGCGNTVCDTINVTFSGTVQPLIDTYCLGCHSGSLAPSYNFSAYSGIKQSADDGALIGSIRHNPSYSPMPKNAQQFNECQIRSIEIWVSQGAPNN